jgi:small subunit ribosomal protein S16
MVKIRLRRVGARRRPSYRLVVADARMPRGGAVIGVIGHYDPLTNPETIVVDQEKALSWLKQGAQPTATAARLLAKAGVKIGRASCRERVYENV